MDNNTTVEKIDFIVTGIPLNDGSDNGKKDFAFGISMLITTVDGEENTVQIILNRQNYRRLVHMFTEQEQNITKEFE